MFNDSTCPIPAHLLRKRVYLLHVIDPATGTSAAWFHARHYLGTADDLSHRLDQHRKGTGARLTQVYLEHGLSWVLARTWRGGRRLERKLKSLHNSPQLCPICRGEITLESVLAEQSPPTAHLPGRRVPMQASTRYFN